MPDVIHLLPDNIANQIAAGEVIQRPASAVKELMENAIDAGATHVKLIIQDAGKALIQVIDNGKGMSVTDARMAFERHATSKIKNIDDLFRIRTMGFRGEALASIAAVAQVELKTKKAEDESGTLIEIENSAVTRQEPVALTTGTSIAMKNLFFNVPARRNFLKSNAAEMRHIIDEFIRIALSFPDIVFILLSGGQEVFHLERGSLKQRIVQILGASYAARLVTVQEDTDYLNITGFVGKPDTAKRTRGDQFFFVNNRFIKSAYLNHAVVSAFQDMIPRECFPLYVLFIDLDPSRVDINVHPTKQEIKFEDEKLIYAFVQAAVKHALAQFSITPSLDFDLDPAIQHLDAVSKPFTEEVRSGLGSSSLFQTFTQKHQAHLIEPSRNSSLSHWTGTIDIADHSSRKTIYPLFKDHEQSNWVQLQLTYIICETNNGFLIIHQQAAHERILYEKFMTALEGKSLATQPGLFPATLQLSAPDAMLLQELLPDLLALGFLVEAFGRDSFIIQGTPADLATGNETRIIEKLLEQVKHSGNDKMLPVREKMIRSLSYQQAVKPGTMLTTVEMKSLVDGLFACAQPNMSPNGKPVFVEYKNDYLDNLFGR